MNRESEAEGNQREGNEHVLLRWVAVGEQIVGASAVLAIFVLVLIQALQRYLPVTGWLWTGELSRFCLVWLTLSMTGYLLGRGQHITLQVIDGLVAARLLRLVKAFANLVVAVISAGFIIEAIALLRQHGQVSPALQMPMEWLYVLPLLGFAATAIRGGLAVFRPSVVAAGTARRGSSREGA